MKNITALILVCILFVFFTSCSSNLDNQIPTNSAETIAAIVNGTLSAVPSTFPTTTPVPTIEFTPTVEVIEETPTLPIPTDTPIAFLVPLYWELTWENLGSAEQEVLVNQQTSERIILSGYTYQAPLPSEKNDLVNNVSMYYSPENMKTREWQEVSGWGGVTGITIEYYHGSGYFLTVRFNYGQNSSVVVWISDETTVVPVISTTQN